MENRSQNKEKLYKSALILLGFAVLVVIVLLFAPKTTRMISENEPDEIVYLTCKLTGRGELYPLFFDFDYDDVNYEVRMKFVNQDATELSTTIAKKFDTVEDAKDFVNRLQANYNIYVGQRNISQEGMMSTYTFVDNIGKMVISVNGKYLAYNNASLLMLGNEIVSKKTVADYEDFFSKKNFICDAG